MTENAPAKLRLFLAVKPSDAALAELERAIAQVRGPFAQLPLRWVGVEKLHVTLRFFGSVASDAPAKIDAVCSAACAGTRSFTLTFAGAGAFPNARRASVLWAGVSDGAAELSALAERVNPALDALGFEREERAFRPHLTLARSKVPQRLTAAIEALSGLTVSTPVNELHLVRSHLGAKARYEVVGRYRLAAAHG